MKYCQKCGKELMEEAVICTSCGCAQAKTVAENDSSSFGWALLGFCIPIVGLILYLVWKDNTPLKAKSAGKGALVAVITGIILWVIYFILIMILGFSVFSAASSIM